MSISGKIFSWTVILLCLVYVIAKCRPATDEGFYHYSKFGELPIVSGGRIKPIDTEARTALMLVSHRQAKQIEGRKVQADEWLLGVMARPQESSHMKTFRVDHPDVKTLLDLNQEEKYFSYQQLTKNWDRFIEQLKLADAKKASDRTLYETRLLQTWGKIREFQRYFQVKDHYLAAPLDTDNEWMTLSETSDLENAGGVAPASGKLMWEILQSYHDSQANTFNQKVYEYTAQLNLHHPEEMQRVKFEVFFNRFSPFGTSMALYVIIILLSVLSWLAWQKPLSGAAMGVMIIALLVHSFGIIARMYIQGRPPVTNLYSSAVFVGWGAVALAIILELIFKRNIGGILAGAIGFSSLLLAQNLGSSGDTMEMMQAVLDTNFWLATHVVTITLGYMATYVAGLLAIIYVLGGIFTSGINQDDAKALTRMVYGTICFALLLSFVGTILGGIWADQSWGRFWGWDPKENGALMIVLWNALLLHARWGGMVKQRGFMVMAIFGNVVTTWSWFGTNLLGVGLHSYGFMEGAKFWLLAFNVSQMGLIAMGLLPIKYWKSFGEGSQSDVHSP